MCNPGMGLTLSSRIYTDNTLRFRLLVPNGVSNYLLYSEPQVFENKDMLTIAVRRKNNVYFGGKTKSSLWLKGGE